MTHNAVSYINAPVVYLIKSPQEENLYKIGRTAYLKERVRALNAIHYTALEVIHVIPMDSIAESCRFETALHRHLKEYRVRGEWFRLPRLSIWDSAVMETFRTVAQQNAMEDYQIKQRSVRRHLKKGKVKASTLEEPSLMISVSTSRSVSIIKQAHCQAVAEVVRRAVQGKATK